MRGAAAACWPGHVSMALMDGWMDDLDVLMGLGQ